MTYLCFIETQTSSVPHMEALDADTLEEAQAAAHRMIGEHRAPVAVHLFKGEDLIQTVFVDRNA